MAAFVAGWTRSVIGSVAGREVVLVVDETKLKDKFGVMVVGFAVGGRCIPLAWRMYRANDKAAYPSEGQSRLIIRLLKQIRAGVPASCRVRVLADRGIGTSPLLMRGIMAMGWTFLFQVTSQSKIVLPDGQAVCFYQQVTQPGQTYRASGQVFKQRGRIPAHVRVWWGAHAQDRWALVTNDPALSGWEYAQRMWIEEAFRDLKSYGWHVEDTAFTDPDRLARLWIFLVIAYGWLLLFGLLARCTAPAFSPQRGCDRTLRYRWSAFREGRHAFFNLAFPP
jgi:hypothetical protein